MQRDVLEVEKLFQALGREKRMRIIDYLLRHDAQSVSTISQDLGLPFNTVSRHLIILANVGLVTYKKVHTEVKYSIDIGVDGNKKVFFYAIIKKAYEIEKQKGSNRGSLLDVYFLTSYENLRKYVQS